MASLEQFSVSWDNFHKEIRSGISSLLENEDFVDVTLAIEGRYLKAHKMVLSVCSSYFRELFKTTPCTHPIVFMKDVSYTAVSDLLQFMYKGEVQVSEENFNTFIQTAESLQIRGLSNCGYGSAEPQKPKSMEMEVPTSNNSLIPASKQETILLKTESYDEEESTFGMADEDSQGNFLDDPLDEVKPGESEDFWMKECDDEQVEEHSKEDELEESSSSATPLAIPQKSVKRYERAFDLFQDWCDEKKEKNITEKLLMTYFEEKLINLKSSSLFSTYSMLRSMLLIRKNIDISKYRNLLAFLKRKSKGYKAKKTKAFTREELEKFLVEANDETYLMMKVATIIGVIGACGKGELSHLLIEHVIDEGNFIRVEMPNANTFLITPGNINNLNLLEIIRKYIKLRPPRTDHQRFFIGYQQGKCTKQPVGHNSFGLFPKKIAQFLGLANHEQYTGHSFKRTSTLFKLVPELRTFP